VDLGFYVTDANGSIKAKPGGAGASLADPVTAVHGGTGLTTVPQASFIISDVDNSIGQITKDTDHNKVMSIDATAGDLIPKYRNAADVINPAAGGGYIIQPGSKEYSGPKVMAAFPQLAAVVDATNPFGLGWAAVAGTETRTNVTDATTTWTRDTCANTTGSTAQLQFASFSFRLDQEMLFAVKFRTGSSIAVMRFTLGLNSAGAQSNTDTPAGTFALIRYYTTLTDPGWMAWTGAGGVRIQNATQIANIVASTIYTAIIKIYPVGANLFADFTIGGATQTLPIQTAGLETAVSTAYIALETRENVVKAFDTTAMYLAVRRNNQFA